MTATATEDDLSQLSGGALREKLEEAIKQNRELQTEVTSHRAKDVLEAKGYDLVKPEDLSGVSADKLEARAKEIQAEREALQTELLTKALEKQGFAGKELDEILAEAVGQREAATPTAQAISRARSLGTGGDPVPEVNAEKLHGFDAVRAGLENPKRRRTA
jgi:phosphopantothenoylcysteine synthetase/decarboxylase